MTTRRMLIVVALLALAGLGGPGSATAAVFNGPVGWTEPTGPHSGRWLSRGLTDFRATVHSERVGINGVYSPNGALFATLLGTWDDRLTFLDDGGDNRGTLVTSAGPPAYARDLLADWSKDGRLILLRRSGAAGPDHGVRSLVVIDRTTGAERTIPTPTLELWGDASFTPDSRRIVFAAQNETRSTDKLYVVGVDGAGLRQLPIGGPGWDMGDPSVSPDGRRVAFVRDYSVALGGDAFEDRREIVVADLDGGNLQFLTHRQFDDSPTWSPDGNSIAFIRNLAGACGGSCSFRYDVFVMRSNGAAQFDLSASPGYPSDPSWQPVPGPGPFDTAAMSLQPAAVPLALRLGQLIPLHFTCPRGDRTCSGVLEMRSEHITIATRHYRVRAGRAAVLRLRVRALTAQLRQDDRAATLRIVAHARSGPQPVGGAVQLKAPSDLSVTCPRELLPGQPAILTGDVTPGGAGRRARAAAASGAVGVVLANVDGQVVNASARAGADGVFRLTAPLAGGTWRAVASTPGDRAHLPGVDGCAFRVREAPVVFVDEPGAGASVPADAPVALRGRAFDDDGRSLDGASLVWKVDGAEVARGAGASVRISAAGRHAVRLEATDARGLTSAAEVSVEVPAPQSSASSSSPPPDQPPPPPPAQKAQTSLTASCDPGKSTFPGPVKVGGALTPAFAGASIRIVYTRSGAPAQEQPGTQTVTTAADGTWSDSYKPPATGDYTVQAFYDGDGGHAPSQAKPCAWTVEK